MSLQNSVCVIRLWLNFCFLTVNCLDQHVEKSPDRVALIWERDEPGTAVHVTYRYGTLQCLGLWWGWEKNCFSEPQTFVKLSILPRYPSTQDMQLQLVALWWGICWKMKSCSNLEMIFFPWLLREGFLILDAYIINVLHSQKYSACKLVVITENFRFRSAIIWFWC